MRELRVFVTVVEQGSFRKAAAALHITQPAVTKAIASLEDLVGVRLFDRTSNGADLTVHGETFARHATNVFGELRSAARQLAVVSRGEYGSLRVGTVPMPALGELPVALSELVLAHPDVFVAITESPEQELIDLLRRRDLDVVFTRGMHAPRADDLRVEPLFDVWLCAFAGRHHPLASRPVVQWQEACRWPWMMPPPESAFRRAVVRILEGAGLALPEHIIEAASVHMQYKMVLQGSALSFGLRPATNGTGTTGDFLVRLPVDLPVVAGSVCAITLRQRTVTPLVERLVDHVRRAGAPV
ncbi:MAG: LysR family transcriptional regulator [Proteobacteria bacterium]|nr:LysR family transcriptional regulator [Pseudomonadota bacterium]